MVNKSYDIDIQILKVDIEILRQEIKILKGDLKFAGIIIAIIIFGIIAF